MSPEKIPVAQIRVGLSLLLEAFDCAHDAGRDPWDFAIEIAELLAAGISLTHLRWLTCKDYLQHAVEYLPRGDDKRQFQVSGKLNFRKRSCFILTPHGCDFARSALQGPAAPAPPDPPPEPANSDPSPTSPSTSHKNTNGKPAPDTPTWNARLRRLTLGHIIVKEFCVPAPNQERILIAFQEEAWTERIDDPLPPVKGKNAKRRLHDTINSLNRNQQDPCIRFSGDGTGDGIRWEVMSEPHRYFSGREGVITNLPFRRNGNGVVS